MTALNTYLIKKPDCNFTYSLLGIETINSLALPGTRIELQFHLLPIRDWNKFERVGNKMTDPAIAISLTPY